jgi:hypothetical protein
LNRKQPKKIKTLSELSYLTKKSAGLINENWLALDKRNCGAWRIATTNSYKNNQKFSRLMFKRFDH